MTQQAKSGPEISRTKNAESSDGKDSRAVHSKYFLKGSAQKERGRGFDVRLAWAVYPKEARGHNLSTQA